MAKVTALRSALFSFGGQSLKLLAFVGTAAVLGRLLTPEDFGVFALATGAYTLFLPLLDLGLMPAFVKMRHVDRAVSNAFFTANLACGIVSALLFLAVSTVIWLAFGDSMLVALSLAYFVSIIVDSVSKQRMAIATRDCRFDLVTAANLASLLPACGVAIAAACMDWGAWSFVARILAQSGLLYLAYRVLVRQRFRIAGLDEIRSLRSEFRFAGSIVVSRLLGGVYRSVDKLCFGALFGSYHLGLYSRAWQLGAMPDGTIRTALSTPAYAHIVRHEPSRRGPDYLRLSHILFLVAGTPCLLLIVMGDQLITLLMGPQWVSAGTYVQVLGLWGVGEIMHGIGAVVYMADGEMRPWIHAHLLAIVLLAGFVGLVGTLWDAIGFVVSISCTSFVFWSYVLLHKIYRRSGGVAGCLSLIRTMAVSTAGVIVTGLLARAAVNLVQWPNVWTSQAVCVAAVAVSCCSVVAVLHWLLNRPLFLDVVRLIRPRVVEC